MNYKLEIYELEDLFEYFFGNDYNPIEIKDLQKSRKYNLANYFLTIDEENFLIDKLK